MSEKSEGLVERATRKIEKLFASINENSHPVGTKTWLLYWKQTEEAVKAVLAECLEKPLQEIFTNRPEIIVSVEGYIENPKQMLTSVCEQNKDCVEYLKKAEKRVFGDKKP